VIIGKLFSAQLLGFYARARQTRDIPLNLISSIFQSITFPAFSMIQDDPSRQKRLMRNAINNIAFFNFPVMIGLSIVAQPTISILLTDKWLDSVPLMQLFCFGGLLSPFTTVYTGYILSRGKSKTNLKIAIIINSLRIFLLIFTWKWGIAGIVWGEVVLSFLSYSIYMFWLSKNIDYKLREQLSDTIPYLVAASLMGVSAFFAGALLGNASPYTLLSTQIAVGTLSYFLICVIFQPLAYRDSISQVLQYLRPNRTPDL
jgi:O-antigen/teichoic acid export membrane protein